MVGVGDEQLGSKRCGGGRRQAIVLELTQLGGRQNGRARKGLVDVGDERLDLNGCGWVGDRQLGLKRPGRG